MVTSLGIEGYDFNLVEIPGQPVRLVVDPKEPIIVPLARNPKNVLAGPIQPGLGFHATFDLENHTSVDRKFEFVDQYYADIKIIFTIFNSKEQVVWQSYQTEVDIPPLAKKVHLTLAASDNWHKTVFIPLEHADHSLLADGEYTLQAEVIGNPGYMASAPFRVTTIIGGPIINPVGTK